MENLAGLSHLTCHTRGPAGKHVLDLMTRRKAITALLTSAAALFHLAARDAELAVQL